MVNKILTKITVVRKKNKNGKAVYRSPRIYLSTKLTDDSSFPFREGQPLLARVVGERLVIERIRRARGKG
jgi:hypothetical protein